MIDKYEPCSICEEYIEGVICNKDKCPVAKMKAEFEKLRTDYGNMAQHALILIGNARTEAVKEFADRLKKCSQWLPLVAMPDPFVIVSDIDNLVKEMGVLTNGNTEKDN